MPIWKEKAHSPRRLLTSFLHESSKKNPQRDGLLKTSSVSAGEHPAPPPPAANRRWLEHVGTRLVLLLVKTEISLSDRFPGLYNKRRPENSAAINTFLVKMPSASGLPLRSRRSLVLLGAVLPSGSSQHCCGSVSADRCHSVTLTYAKGNGSQVPLLGGLLATCGAAAQGWQREQKWAGVQPGIRAAWKRHPNPSVTMRGLGEGGRWAGTFFQTV